jgi:hypothetical protein
MSPRTFQPRLALIGLGWLTLLAIPIPILAADNLWQSSVGQTSFYETRSSSGEHLAGTAWESSLIPGYVYNISFGVRKLQGKIGLLIGDLPVIPIDAPGDYSFDFAISEAGERRMMFETRSDDVAVRVNRISVTQQSQTPSVGTGFELPSGHYWSFDGERNLNAEMVVPLENPESTTNYRLGIARDLHDALTTPGARGFWFSVDWRTVEIGDGKYDWSLIDDNVKVARDLGLKVIVQVADRSFDATDILPAYFPAEYRIPSSGGGSTGVVAKRWDSYVYSRVIRLYAAIADRYAFDPAFAGIGTPETALGQLTGGDYTLAAYRNALTQIVTQGQGALKTGELLFYLNFLPGGDRSDMNKDARVSLLRDLPHGSLLVGAPDITPDVKGMVRSVSPYRIHARKYMPGARQFCHLQHVDQGHRGINVKNNQHRVEYLDEVAAVREREAQPWFAGEPAVFEFDDVGLHPDGVLGDLWQPQELLDFGRRNFDCAYVFWHYRSGAHWEGAVWQDVREVILQNQDF